MDLIGFVILLTGVLHMMTGFRIGDGVMNSRIDVSIIEGAIEIIHGWF